MLISLLKLRGIQLRLSGAQEAIDQVHLVIIGEVFMILIFFAMWLNNLVESWFDVYQKVWNLIDFKKYNWEVKGKLKHTVLMFS